MKFFRWRFSNLLQRIGLIQYRELDASFAKLEPGQYILVLKKGTLPQAVIRKIGFPESADVHVLKVQITGDLATDVALWRLEKDSE